MIDLSIRSHGLKEISEAPSPADFERVFEVDLRIRASTPSQAIHIPFKGYFAVRTTDIGAVVSYSSDRQLKSAIVKAVYQNLDTCQAFLAINGISINDAIHGFGIDEEFLSGDVGDFLIDTSRDTVYGLGLKPLAYRSDYSH